MFDWQTDEDEVAWDEENIEQTELTPSFKWRWWHLLLIGFVVGGSWTSYAQIQRQTESAVVNIEEDVISSFELLIDAVEQNDNDLFTLLLSGRDMEWVSAQQFLIQQDQFFNSAPLGLTYVQGSSQVVDVTLSPSLESAELKFEQRFEHPVSAESVTLMQTAVFRRGRDRWLFAAPEDDFWGEWQTVHQGELTVIFPERDAAWVSQILAELDTWIPQVCREIDGLSCRDWDKIIRFDNTPESKTLFYQREHLYNAGQQLNLPSPSLIGVPTDLAGEKALLNQYKSLFARILIANEANYICCRNGAFFETILNYQLAQLDMYEWPIDLDVHYALWQRDVPPNTTNFISFWGQESLETLTEDEAIELAGLIDFLLQMDGRNTAFKMQEALIDANQSFNRWVLNFTPLNFDQTYDFDLSSYTLDDQWQLFATLYYQAGTSLPDNLPNQALNLVCLPTNTNNIKTNMYQFHPDEKIWQLLSQKDGYGVVFPLKNDSQILYETLPFERDNQETSIQLWSEEGIQIVSNLENGYQLSLGQKSPNGRFAAVYSFDPIVSEENISTSVFDLQSCATNGCDFQATPGIPFWSPDSSQVIFQPTTQFDFVGSLPDDRFWQFTPSRVVPLVRTQMNATDFESTLVEIGLGNSPNWLDNETYIYVRFNMSLVMGELVMESIEDDSRQSLITDQDLLDAGPGSAESWRISMATPIPGDDNRLAVFGLNRGAFPHLFLYDIKSDELTYQTQLGSDFSGLMAFSPNGRYLAAASGANLASPTNQGEEIKRLMVIDLESGQTQSFIITNLNIFPALGFDWSQDSEWLAIQSGLNIIQLVHIESGSRTLLKHPPHNDCNSLSWTTPFSPEEDG